MGAPEILWENFYLLAGATVTDPSAASGFPATRLRDRKNYLAWKAGGAGTLDYKVDLGVAGARAPTAIAIVGHNLFSTGTSWALAFSDDDVTYTVVTSGTPTADRIAYRSFSTTSHRYWRVRLTSATTSTQVGEIILGRSCAFPFGLVWDGFDPLRERSKGRATRAQGGAVLRQTVEYVERSVDVDVPLLPASFYDDVTLDRGFRWIWEQVLSKGYPVVFSWNPGDPGSFEADAFWAVADLDLGINRPLRTPSSGAFRDVMFRLLGVREA